jgi:MFS family permease
VRAVLGLSNYRRLLVAYALNELAWSIGSLALALVVYKRTNSALGAAAFFLSAQFLPALGSPLLVARIDRLPARPVLTALYALQGLGFVGLTWLAAHFELGAVLALTLATGIVALGARSIARATATAVIAPLGLLREGNAVTNAVFAVCIMAGPAIGGALVLAGGARAALLFNSCAFAVITAGLATAANLPDAEPGKDNVTRRLRAAIELVIGDEVLRPLFLIQSAALVFFTLSIPVEVVFAEHSLRAGAGGYGALLSAWGAGAVVGSAAYARWRALSVRWLIAASSVSLGAGFLVMAAAPSLAVAIVGSALGGGANGVEAVALRTALQERVPQSWMAMMLSLNESMFQALPGVGIVLGGALAAVGGPRVAFAVGGVGAFVVATITPFALRATSEPLVHAAGESSSRSDPIGAPED